VGHIVITDWQKAKPEIASVRANEALVVSHDCMKPLVEDYLGRIPNAYDQAAAFTAAD
jgi:hypothetical protein